MTACDEFTGTRNAGGYGVLTKAVNGSRLAHRAALAEKLGRPVVGMARHTCDNPPCIEPSHLLDGTQAENVADAVARGRTRGGRYNQAECINGHALVDGNVRIKLRHDGYTERLCLECRRINSTKQSERRKAARHERGLIRTRKA
ncbi:MULTISPECIES: hypothetical protein [Cryobacterium]|uniref:HNH endonuclease n=1 Tax=Cryobacterium breve TaxID=1259258 RepID=A0ABY2J6W2_9MICO|nr:MULTISPECIES: hypothetical protein [Cryobacterium]TFC92063.1 hypothetical protein E3T20_12170 [Cryobacterium sp. TmT3-12]TFC99798.1 hypothetical protein E3O65_05335 [Cryobacterium breve]